MGHTVILNHWCMQLVKYMQYISLVSNRLRVRFSSITLNLFSSVCSQRVGKNLNKSCIYSPKGQKLERNPIKFWQGCMMFCDLYFEYYIVNNGMHLLNSFASLSVTCSQLILDSKINIKFGKRHVALIIILYVDVENKYIVLYKHCLLYILRVPYEFVTMF